MNLNLNNRSTRISVRGTPLTWVMLFAGTALLLGCASDGVAGDDGVYGLDASVTGGEEPDAAPSERACDMSGRWIAEQHTVAVALNADQFTTNYYYYDITQVGDTFTLENGLNCGFVVDGTTTVTLGDDTLVALAQQESLIPGRQGTFTELNENQCSFELERTYNIRGANKATYLTDHWNVGDPAIPLTEMPDLPKAPPGMEDWDADGKDGVTLTSGLGPRYVAHRDWNEHSGTVPTFVDTFGGDGIITVTWDTQEAVSTQTAALLRIGATPKGTGWARYARVGDSLQVSDSVLETCRAVQQLATQRWPN